MPVTLTGASGLIGAALLCRLREADEQVRVLTRDPARAARLGGVEVIGWDPSSEPAPVHALAGSDVLINLAGAPVAQRWSARAKQAIRDSRVRGTSNLIEGLRACDPDQRPRVLVSASAVGYYGAHGEEPLDEDAQPGADFLAEVCVAWEEQALSAAELGLRVVTVRTGVVLDPSGGALGQMLAPFRLGLGGPIAGGEQYISWIHIEDLAGLYMCACEREDWSGPVNATSPQPVTNREFSKTLGAVLHRPAVLPLPAGALRLIYGEGAQILTSGARVMPAKPLVLGYRFRHPQLQSALRDLLD